MKTIKKEAFNSRGNSYKEWTRTASGLLAAATVLCREREKADSKIGGGCSIAPMEVLTFWVELMLCGFAIECLLKALWVKKGNLVAKDGAYLKVMEKENHDLVALCRKIAFPLQPREEAVLAKLSELARATGRYPIARHFTDMHADTLSWSGDEDRITEVLVRKLKREIAGTKPKKT